MLYDPKWQKQPETKADPFALATLIGWLELQPTDEEYNYTCNGHCCLALYFAAQGFDNIEMKTTEFTHSHGKALLPRRFNSIAQGGYRGDPSYDDFPRWTFGAALARARLFVR